ncbi:FtsX-like permease family protein [Rubellimicrobium roseum]|uniref:FtsX-like permease family protein n=2 Tax=Rubellimicrobium roseum TaxID=687525 RepID=A0A5C4N4H2_9RHOB|nr:FtsX-like permease family protein [Rubellimicrobium roseum]
MAAGVATLVLGVGAVSSLERTRDAFYEANRFADIFANATRAPRSLLERIEDIPGVLDAEGRILRIAILDMPGMAEPGSLLLVSTPSDDGLNRLHLRLGRMPDPNRLNEVVVSQGFAEAHGLVPGDKVRTLMDGRTREITVTGVAISPEFIYALGPGDMMPDPRRFGIAWIPGEGLAAVRDLEGAFDNLIVKLATGASEARVIAEVDALLEPYGGTGATGRKEQISHAFLDAELQQLRGMARVLPPIFLLVSALLVNMTLGRLVALEREQIGLLKALGYGPGAIVRHYVGFVLAIAAFGIAAGWAAGAWMGAGLAGMYARFFDFPFLLFSRSPDTYAIAALVTTAAAVLGAVNAVRTVAWLPPAVAMAPPAPVRYRRFWGGAVEQLLQARQTSVMVVRHLLRWPLRTLGGVFGISLAVAALVGSLWSFGSGERMIDLSFFRMDRQDVSVVFSGLAPMAAIHEVRRLPGVLRAEPLRVADARIGSGHVTRRIAILGLPEGSDLSRLLAADERPMEVPEQGLVLSEALADILGVGIGDQVTLELLKGDRRTLSVPVREISLGYLGLSASGRLETVNRMLGEGSVFTGARIALDPSQEDAFYADVRETPGSGFLTIQSLSLRKFRETLAQNQTIMISVLAVLAGIIAFGVVYNFIRISLSEQGRELASLRVLGFTRSEVAAILYGEIAVVTLLAQPLGWLVGTGFAVAVVRGFGSELYRIPLVIGPEVYARASLIVLGAALASALLVRGRIARLDMIEVLKTRE